MHPEPKHYMNAEHWRWHLDRARTHAEVPLWLLGVWATVSGVLCGELLVRLLVGCG